MDFFLAVACLACLLAYMPIVKAQEAVCAEVRIEIRQKVSLERQAFEAVLRIRNGLGTASIENVSVDVLFSDMEGNPVIASSDPNNLLATFFIRLDSLEGVGAVDGTGTVAPESTGTIRWMIIPSASAGGNTPVGVMYMVGARLQYHLGGEENVVDVVPETITVRPQPRLALDYFLAGDVYSDDPFTPEIEPPVPFTLGLRIRNTGAGVGQKVNVESAQPRIVENEQGLLVGFNIVGGHVDDQPAAPSLLLNFGDIPAGGVRMGRWLMETTLSGRFVSIDANYTHADSLGGALTSLIDGEPATHLLLHDVLVDLPGRDGVRDFLARDGDVLRVYESNGLDTEVVDRSSEATLVPVSGGPHYSLGYPATVGFSYARVVDPGHGTAAGLSVRRPDGRLLPSENSWLSKSRNPDMSWAYFLNVFDAEGGGNYTVEFDASPATSLLSGSVYVDANGNGIRDAGEAGLDGVTMLLEGASSGGSVQRSTVSQDGGVYRFADLPPGSYAISVGAISPYGNGIHQSGTAGGVVEAGRISGIALGADANGDGYIFAKTLTDTGGTADLQIVALEAVSPVATGEATSITVQVRNIGPQATLARTVVTVPETFALAQAQPSVGSFDAGTGIWSHGALVPGQQHDLVLQGAWSQIGTWVLDATVNTLDDHMVDPDASNDARTMEVVVQPPSTLSVVLERAPVTDLLFWVSCIEDAGTECTEGRAQRWESLLSQTGIRYRVETNQSQFLAALRSGDWPSVWIDGGVALASGTVAAEIRESVRRGGALVVSGVRNPEWERFEALTGSVHVADVPAGEWSVQLAQNEYFQAGALSTTGAVAVYAQAEGRVLGEYKPGMAAIIGSHAGTSAPVLVFGFDPLPGIEMLSEPTTFLATLSAGAAVRIPEIVPNGGRLPLRVVTRRPDASEGALALAAGFPQDFTVLEANPDPTDMTAASLSWVASWPVGSVFEVRYVLRTPSGSGIHELDAAAHWQDEEDDAAIGIQVRDRQTQNAHAATALDQLATTSEEDSALKQLAAAHLASAETAYAQGDQAGAIVALLAALEALDAMAAPGADAVALEVSRLLLAMAREAPVVEQELFSDGFESDP